MSDLAEMLSSAKAQGYKEGRADAIEPISAIIEESERMMWCADKTLEKVKEQLKEQTE